MTRRGRGRPRETTHDEIRDIARALFLSQGYAATSLQQIADVAGISRTTLFHYFPAKRDLMADEFDASFARLREALENNDRRPLVEALAAGIAAALQFTRQEHDALALRWRIVRSDEELRADVTLRTRDIIDLLIEHGRAQAPGAAPSLVAHIVEALMAVVLSATTQWVDRDEPAVDLDAHVTAELAPFVAALSHLLA
ncbi:MAG: TetR/AcrR family transcriptional regulator [Microbacterium sp.]|uniref:TetR/AcrR family transcriptional regulator n=1 Tax=Microbacterium sp. TaxID=51671 RepID=UPI0039E6E2E3